ncbi:hypothetical protein J1614_006396 [Plenodomus biglobosus]|nr:hypothetical protein J1614_006396 [Plenodomus biglobosus]
MRVTVLTSLVLASSAPCLAATPLCQKSCESALSYIKFTGNTTKPQCTNDLHITSYFACLERYCPSQRQDGYSALQKSCKGDRRLPELSNLTVSVDGLAEFMWEDIRKKSSTAGVLSPSLYALSERTITSAAEADELNTIYGNALFGFWALILLLATLAHLTSCIKTRTQARLHLQSPQWLRNLVNGTRRHLLIPKFIQPQNERLDGWCAFPTRLQSLVVLAYIALNVVLHLLSHDVFEGNLKRPRISAQVARSLGHRTGTLIVANLPILWTFAMRNNVLAWCSGWSFATFNVYHRWIARVVVAELVAHAVAYSLVMHDSGGWTKYKAQWKLEYWIWGVMALIMGSIMCVASMYPLRRRSYDVFLLGHILFALVFLIGTWFHLKKSADNFYVYYWPCVAVWVFDRTMRFGRLITLNRSLGRALVTYDADCDMLRLDVPVRSLVRPQAGTYYYIYILHGARFWESHPFTLSSWTAVKEPVEGGKTGLQFLIRPLAGFTARLKHLALQDGNGNVEKASSAPKGRRVLALVEGPYGHTNKVHSYDSALFIVGGSGITVAMGHLQSLNAYFERGGDIALQKAHIVWAVRYADLASGVLESDIIPRLEASGLAAKIEVHFDIYVTQRTAGAAELKEKRGLCAQAGSEKLEAPSTDAGSSAVAIVRYHDGRPPLEDILVKHVDRPSAHQGKTAVISCGPAVMANEVGVLVAQALKGDSSRIDYFPESFSW